MKLFTNIEIAHSAEEMTFDNRFLLLGSCFSDNIGQKLRNNGFSAVLNPFGTLYNPLSIARCLKLWLTKEPVIEENIYVQNEGLWHSMLHHSRFSMADKEQFMENIRQSLTDAKRALDTADILIVTFGTAYVFYRQGEVVSNCHKLPASQFERRRLTVDEIVGEWQPLLRALRDSGKRVIFTVSPIRHKADGMHGNQLSKATLLLAIDALQNAEYFPSYELLLDEMRDYRFYATDMLHPSEQAVDYIWEKFADTYFSPSTTEQMKQQYKAYIHSQHRPITTMA